MQVRVENLNDYPYTEKFRGKDILIEPKSHILMDEDEADYFLQTFKFPKKDSQGRPDPKHFKKLRINPDDMQTLRLRGESEHICHANGQKADSAKELNAILSRFAHMRADDEENEGFESLKKENQILKKQNKTLQKQNTAILDRLSHIEQQLGLNEEKTDEETLPAKSDIS